MQIPKTAAYYITPIDIVLLWAKITCVKSHSNVLGFWSPNRYEIDLSNEVLYIHFCQGATQIPWIKVEVRKKYLPIGSVWTHAPRVSQVGRYFFQPPTLTSHIFAAPWSKSMFSSSFERSISYLFGDQSPQCVLAWTYWF